MSAIWTDEGRLALIEEVKKRHEIWEYKKEHYATSERKREVFGEIAEVINALGFSADQVYTEDDVRTQWKNLKDTFKRKLKKRKADLEAGIEDNEPSWRFWTKMLFMENNFGPDRDRSSILNSLETQNSFESLINSLVEKQVSEENGHHSMDHVRPPDELSSLIASNMNSDSRRYDTDSSSSMTVCNGNAHVATAVISNPPSTFTDKQLSAEIGTVHSPSIVRRYSPEIEQRLRSRSPNSAQHQMFANTHRKVTKRKVHELDDENSICSRDDEFSCFGRCIAASLRRVALTSPIASLTLKKQITDLIFEAELKQLVGTQKHCDHSTES